MYLLDRLRENRAQKRMMHSLEGLFRTYYLEAELNKLYPEPINYQRRAHRKINASDRLQRRKLQRENGLDYLQSLENQLKYQSIAPLHISDSIHSLRDRYRSKAFKECIAHPVLFRRAGNAFTGRIENYLQRHAKVVALETRIAVLEARLDSYQVRYQEDQTISRQYSPSMRAEITKGYATDYSRSLKSIAKSLSAKYNRPISESAIRRIARKELGNVSRRNSSAKRAYERNCKTRT